MQRQEIDRKLDQIGRQTAEELTGWVQGLHLSGRALFDGESAALTRRARALGHILPTLPKAPPAPAYDGPQPWQSPLLE